MSLNQYEVVSVLSDGNSSRVELVKDGDSGERWVRKSVSTADLHPQSLKLLTTEVQLLRDLDHPNVMGIREYMEDVDGGQFITILEHIPGSDCSIVLQKDSVLDESAVASIVSQILSALIHCHARNIIHRDVKPENIIVAQDRRCGYHATLIDFGSAARGKEGGLELPAGTQAYMAPDMLVGSPHYDGKVDVWSCGASAFEMLMGKPPFGSPADYGGDANKVCKRIRAFKRSADPEAELATAPRWKELSEEARDFLRQALAADPDARPTAVEAAAHNWLLTNKEGIAKRERRLSSPKKGGA